MAKLAGKIAYITGGGAGIGRAAATLFAKEGATVVIAEFNEANGLAAQEAIRASGGQAHFVKTDVTSEESVKASVAEAIRLCGRIDVLYNNAGGSSAIDAPVTTCPTDEFWRAIKVDLFGTWITSKYGIAEMVKTGGGTVVNSSSVFALVGTKNKDAYTPAKGAVAALTRSMAVEYAEHKIRVNAVAPAVTVTERVRGLMESQPEVIKMTASRQMTGLVMPEDVAALALYLACDDSRNITGQVVAIDGGMSIN
ncbi:SDR family NAD(P)-dependent oxidoreductase [Ramlibacter sp.]|uniref:SDR family NAD(P)-dependent oxidoreductase n=1 Tax=Ramlibacter sp. TaxID=1917967 RepID=UPI003D0B2595